MTQSTTRRQKTRRPTPRRPNAVRTRETRSTLIAAARKHFAERGYAGAATPEIVAAAGLTRGALYHHYTDKEALFRAVVEAEAAEVARQIAAASIGQPNAIDALLQGSLAFLEAMAVSGRTRLLLLDGPAVLGREAMDRIDAAHAAGSLRDGLEAAIAQGLIKPLPVDALTAQLSALFDRAALAIAQGDTREDHLAVIAAVIEGLRQEPGKNRQ